MKTWEEAKKNEESGNPHHSGSTPRVVRLPETHENSNYILLRIPVEIYLFERGRLEVCMDPTLVPQELGLNEDAMGCLAQGGLVRLRPKKLLAKRRIGHVTFTRGTTECQPKNPQASQAELAQVYNSQPNPTSVM